MASENLQTTQETEVNMTSENLQAAQETELSMSSEDLQTAQDTETNKSSECQQTTKKTEVNMDLCYDLSDSNLIVVDGPRIVMTSELRSINFEEFITQINGGNQLANGSPALVEFVVEFTEKSQDKTEVEKMPVSQSIYDVEPATAIPKGYEYVDIAGRSLNGMVFYCHPPLAVFQKRLQDGPRVVAVKVTPRIQFGDTNREIQLLRNITQKAPSELAQNFIRLLDAEDEPESPSSDLYEYTWLTMDAIHPSITLFQLWRLMDHKRKVVPQAFPLELFLQMVPALMFLHEDLKIAHTDLHGGNIMVKINESESSNSEAEGFSFTFIIIDFGLGQWLTTDAKLLQDGDGRALYSEIFDLTTLCEDGANVDIKWLQFKKTVERPPQFTEHLHPPLLREAFATFKDFAKAKTIEQGKDMSALAEWTREMGDDKAFAKY